MVAEPGAQLLSAAFVAIVPSYISRSCGGSYDNEGVAVGLPPFAADVASRRV